MNDDADDGAAGEGSLQLILGTDRTNPCFCIYSCEETETLHVYYGLELLESVPDDREHFAYKLLVARLYNAGVKARELQRVFAVDRKTMQRWGEALAGDDAERLCEVLEGRNAGRKLTWEITACVKARFAAVRAERPRGYSAALREEIKRVFKVSISGETLRPLLGELRGQGEEDAPGSEAKKRETPCESSPPAWREPAGETALEAARHDESQVSDINIVNAPVELVAAGDAAGEKASLAPPPDASERKGSPVFSLPESAGRFCHHAGLLLFSQAPSALAQNFPPAKVVAGQGPADGVSDGAALLKQWLAALLLGAVNIEQSKFLDFDDLELLLGVTVRSLQPQRLRLAELGQTQTAAELLRFNLRESGACAGTDFYYDPHTKLIPGRNRS